MVPEKEDLVVTESASNAALETAAAIERIADKRSQADVERRATGAGVLDELRVARQQLTPLFEAEQETESGRRYVVAARSGNRLEPAIALDVDASGPGALAVVVYAAALARHLNISIKELDAQLGQLLTFDVSRKAGERLLSARLTRREIVELARVIAAIQ